MKCCICGKEIEGYGNNPAPIAGNQCCDECHQKVVIPYRVFLTTLDKKNAALLITQDEVRLYMPKGKYFTLKELQEAVGGYITLGCSILPGYLTVVDEEGLLKGLPFNKLAFKIFDCDYVGNVLICPEKIFEAPEED